MKQQKKPLRPDLIEAAAHCRSLGGSWHDCTALTGLSVHTLMCEILPGYREQRLAAGRAQRAARPKPEPKPKVKRERKPREPQGKIFSASQMAEYTPPPPQAVLFERDRVMQAPRTLTGALMGDPPPGRSALDRRHG